MYEEEKVHKVVHLEKVLQRKMYNRGNDTQSSAPGKGTTEEKAHKLVQLEKVQRGKGTQSTMVHLESVLENAVHPSVLHGWAAEN